MEKLIFTKKEFKEVMEVLKATAKDDVRPILQGVNFNNNEVSPMIITDNKKKLALVLPVRLIA